MNQVVQLVPKVPDSTLLTREFVLTLMGSLAAFMGGVGPDELL